MAGNKGTITAGITGAVVGAGVALAASKILSNDKSKKKIIDAVGKMKDKIKKA